VEEGDFIPEGRHWVPDNCKSHQHAGEFGSLDEANEILGLMMRHWDTIASTLYRGDAYVPLLLLDEKGMAYGNDWARGFMCGMHMRHDGWAADSHKLHSTTHSTSAGNWGDLQRLVAAPMVSKLLSFRTYKR